MPVVFKITHGATTQSLEAWGISGAVFTRRNLGVDELTFSVAVSNLFAADTFAYGDELVLWRDAVRWFSGTVERVTSVGTGEAERIQVRVVGPWWRLERIVYQQPYFLKSEDFSTLTSSMSTHVTLGQDSWGRKITTNEQIDAIAAYALAQSSGTFVLSALSALVTPPLSTARDISCAAAILRMIEWTPDAAGWFDYSVSPPTLNIVRRESLSAVGLDASAANLIEENSLVPRQDLKVRGVVFTFLTGEEDEVTGTVYPRETKQEAAGGATSGLNVLFATLQLAGQGTDQAEAVPTGLADAYFTALNVDHWEGSIVTRQQDVTAFIRPGNLLNLTNGKATWATMNAMVNSVTHELQTGRTTVEVGPPSYLSAEDFADLMRKTRNQRPAGDWPLKQHNGTTGGGTLGGAPDVSEGEREANDDAGKSPAPAMTSFQAEFCLDGVTKTRTVLGA